MHREIAVVSGKGGTGKTTICAAFSAISKRSVLADCDVDAPDLHILLHPTVIEEQPFCGSEVAVIDGALCTLCGICEENCRFQAARPPEIDSARCEGCGLCEFVCPAKAVQMKTRVSGRVYLSNTRFGPMAHANLYAGAGNSGKLVTEVRRKAAETVAKRRLDSIIIDGAPGIGCPVIATLTGIDLAVIVTEPTITGVHDMNRVLELCRQMGIEAAVIINKHDINPELTQEIESACAETGVQLLGRIPFDPIVTQSMLASLTLPEFALGTEVALTLAEIWHTVESLVFKR